MRLRIRGACARLRGEMKNSEFGDGPGVLVLAVLLAMAAACSVISFVPERAEDPSEARPAPQLVRAELQGDAGDGGVD